MKKLLCFVLLFWVSFIGTHIAHGQKKLKESKRLIWVKSFGKTEESKAGQNYNVPLRFSADLPMLNKKYELSRYTTVFYVLKSDEPERKVFSMYSNGELHTFYTDKINSTIEREVDLGLLANGAIVSYNFYNKNFKKGDEGFLFLENKERGSTELYELLICSDCTDRELKDKIQTYLALKYGISLEQVDRYLSGDGSAVWDHRVNKDFNHHIVGIGKDKYLGLEQRKSYHHLDDFFVIQTSEEQGNIKLKDRTYVLVGDNNKEKKFDKNGLYKRRWLIQNRGEQDVSFDVSFAIPATEEAEYYLHTSLGELYQNDLADTLSLNFKNLKIHPDQDYYLTLEQKKKLDFEIEKDIEGLNLKYILTVNEVGKPPFTIEAKDESSGQAYSFRSEIATFNIEDLPSSTYSFTVNDVDGNVAAHSNIMLDMSDKQLVSLASNWVLPDRGRPLEIKPEIYKPNLRENLKYSWYFNDKLISKLPRLVVNYSGTFSLVITDPKGAKEEFFFTVAPSPQTKEVGEEMEWIVSPNPVEWGEEFTITYLFKNQKKVDFYAYTQDGKFIFRDELGIIEAGSYNYKLPHSSGTYLLVAIINSKTTIQRLIVK